MTSLAQGSAAIALVMCFALLQSSHFGLARMFVIIQCVAVAASAILLGQPTIVVAPVVLAAGTWFYIAPGSMLAPGFRGWPGRQTPFSKADSLDSKAMRPASRNLPPATSKFVAPLVQSAGPVRGLRPSLVFAAVLAVLCQSQGPLAMPLSIVLLSVLLAATRHHRFMQIMALVGTSNGIALGACVVLQSKTSIAAVAGLACLLLPVPLAVGPRFRALKTRAGRVANWFGWADVAVSATFMMVIGLVPLDPIGTLFACLLGLDGIMRSWRRRGRSTLSLQARGSALSSNIFSVLAVCASSPLIAWFALLAAVTIDLQPVLLRSRRDGVSAFLGTGVVLLGVIVLETTPLAMGYFSIFIGSAVIATIIPDLAVVLVILLLRRADDTVWPHLTEPLGLGIAVVSLIGCSVWLSVIRRKPAGLSPSHLPGVALQLGQTAIAASAICTGRPDGRFAGLVVLALLILTRAAARDTTQPVSRLAITGLGGVPLLTLFPGFVLVMATLSAYAGWLVVPLGLAAIPLLAASLPERVPVFQPAMTLPSAGWVPLILALLIGYFTPDGLARWGRMLTAGHG